MVSARKAYQNNLVAGHTPEPVTTAPVSEVAKAPDAVETPQPAEPLEPKPSPAEAAASSAIKQRLEEVQRAQQLVREQAAQYAAEPETPQMEDGPVAAFEQSVAALPERQQAWFKDCPQELWPERVKQIEYNHYVSARETGEIGTPAYYDHMDRALGVRNASPQSELPLPQRQRASEPAPRQASGPPVSAPPSRESHSMSTGRPVGRLSLSREEADLAKSLGLTQQQYLDGKARMIREKQGGFHRDE
jgi:hypothetical protein